MQTLIISIIAIVLTVLLGAATTSFLSDAFTNNKSKAESARYINESGQIMSAITSYKSTGNMIDSNFKLQDLVDYKMLKSIPDGWKEYPDMIAVPIVGTVKQKEAICIETNKVSGYEFKPNGASIKPSLSDAEIGIPYCSVSLDPEVPCCVNEGS